MRFLMATGAALVAMATAATAGATTCTVAKKPISAGQKLYVDVSGAVPDVTVTAQHFPTAGFATLDFDGDGTGDASVFIKKVNSAHPDELGVGFGTMTEGAHNSGPGDSECDGKGIDDLEACGP